VTTQALDVHNLVRMSIMNTEQGPRAASRSERWGFVAGLAAVGVIAYWMSVWFPYQILNTDDGLRSFYQDTVPSADGVKPSGVRTFLPAVLLGPGCLLFAWFLSSLTRLLRRAPGGAGILPWVGFSGGVAFVVLLLAANAAYASVATAAFFMPTFQLDLSVARVFSALSHWLSTQAAVAGSVMVAATALVAFRSDLPRWYPWTSAVVAVLSALTVVLVAPVFLFVGWVALTAVVLLVRSPSATSAMARDTSVPRPG
jgi:hypothetical protein